jgi:hypothetical protein
VTDRLRSPLFCVFRFFFATVFIFVLPVILLVLFISGQRVVQNRHNSCHELREYLLCGLLVVFLVLDGGEWSYLRAGGFTPGGKSTRMASPRTVLSTNRPPELT